MISDSESRSNSWDEAAERLQAFIEAEECRRGSIDADDDPRSDVDLTHPDIRSHLLTIAYCRPLQPDDLLLAHRTWTAEFLNRMQSTAVRHARCEAVSADLKLFRVQNTARKSILVVAVDADCARMFAARCGHVAHEKNAKVFAYKEEYIERVKRDGSAEGRALREGVPGVLKQIGSSVLIERKGKVYTPLTVVK